MATSVIQYEGAFGASSISDRIAGLVSSGAVREYGQSPTKPVGIPEKSIDEAEAAYGKKWYKRWWVWALILGGAAGIGLTIYFVRRRK